MEWSDDKCLDDHVASFLSSGKAVGSTEQGAIMLRRLRGRHDRSGDRETCDKELGTKKEVGVFEPRSTRRGVLQTAQTTGA